MQQLDGFNDDSNHLKGIGGWLIIVAIGITLSPFVVAVQLYQMYQPLFENGSFVMLTDPVYTSYIPSFETLIYAEIGINGLLILASLYLIYLFYTKHYFFPKLYIILAVFYPFFLIADSWAVNVVMPDEAIFDKETVSQIAQTTLSAIIWTSYLLMSERVKNTFVKPEQSVDQEPMVIETQGVNNNA